MLNRNMLDRNYNFVKYKDILELYKIAPPLLRAMFAVIYDHNRLAAKIGYAIKTRDAGRYKTVNDIHEMKRQRDALRKTLKTACKTTGYKYEFKNDYRIFSLLRRKNENYHIGRIENINQKGLFAFYIENGESAINVLQNILITSIIEE